MQQIKIQPFVTRFKITFATDFTDILIPNELIDSETNTVHIDILKDFLRAECREIIEIKDFQEQKVGKPQR